MRIFNKDKTKELTIYDENLGKLQADTLITHIEEQREIKEQSHIEILAKYPNGGKEVERVVDIAYQPYIEAHDEIENILVYIPYTQQELTNITKDNQRIKRKPLLTAFDIWEKAVLRGREQDSEEIMQWYQDILDLKEDALENTPERIQHYL